MARWRDIDHDRKVTIFPVIETQIDDPELVALAKGDPFMLRADVPVEGEGIVLTDLDARRFLEWLAATSWGRSAERDMQCISETDQGEALLTTWLELDQSKQMMVAAEVAQVFSHSTFTALVASWQSLGAARVCIEGFRLSPEQAAKNESGAEGLSNCGYTFAQLEHMRELQGEPGSVPPSGFVTSLRKDPTAKVVQLLKDMAVYAPPAGTIVSPTAQMGFGWRARDILAAIGEEVPEGHGTVPEVEDKELLGVKLFAAHAEVARLTEEVASLRAELASKQ